LRRYTALLLALPVLLQVSSSAQTGGTTARGGNVYETRYIVVDDNGINPDFDNTALPNIPDHWGPTSLAMVIGDNPPNGAALQGRTHLHNRTGYIRNFEIYVASSAMADGDFCSIAVAKEINPADFEDPSVDIAHYLRLTNESGSLKLALHYPTLTGEQSAEWSGTVSLQDPIAIYIEDNILFGRTLFKVDGETVADITHDGAAVQTIDTLILGSSAGSTCRDVVVLFDDVLQTPIPAGGRLPSGITPESPANGATDVEVAATLVCAQGSDADTWEIRYGTVNPPTGDWTSLGQARSLGPLTLANSTTYYYQCRGTNSNGTGSASSVASFTTIATTPPPSGQQTLLITQERLDRWALMKGDYDNSTSSPRCTDVAYTEAKKIGCMIYKGVIDAANLLRPENEGIEQALLAMVPGNSPTFWCPLAYTNSQNSGILSYATLSPATTGGWEREHLVSWTLVYNWCNPYWTQTQTDAYLSRLNAMVSMILNTANPSGFRCADVDMPLGLFYGLAAYYEATKDHNAAAVTAWADDDIGGYTPGALKCSPQSDPANTARNMIAYYIKASSAPTHGAAQDPSSGGAWLESTEYLGSLYNLMEGCEALRTTDAGDAPCAEVDLWVDDAARYYTHRMTRDYQAIYQFGDNQEPHTRWKGFFKQHEAGHVLSLTGVLPDGSDRQYMWRQFLNFRQVNGDALVFPAVWPARNMMLANPYITAASDLTALTKCYQSPGAGIYTRNDSWTGTSSNASQFVFQFKPETRGLDHFIQHVGNFFLYRRGQFVLTNPFGYANAAALMPEGSNTVELEGLMPGPTHMDSTSPQYRQTTGYACGDDYLYAAGTTGGGYRPANGFDGPLFFNPPEHHVDEYTRSVVYLPSATQTYDTVFVIDRANVKDPEALLRFSTYRSNTCYLVTCFTGVTTYGYAEQQHIQDSPRWTSYLWQWIDGDPTIAGNQTTWTLSDGQIVVDDWLTPDDVTITSQDADDLRTFGEPGTTNCPNCILLEERKNRTKVEPQTTQQWNVMVRAITARDSGATAPVVTELSVTGTCGAALITRAGNADRVIVWNNAQGDAITQAVPTAAQATAVLATARYHKAKTCTIPWTQTTATAKVLLLDLNPSLGWTGNLNGAGAVALTEDSGGFDEVDVSGTGSQSLVVIGS
jgi:hypothetical protein